MRALSLIFAALLAATLATHAEAHAFLDHARPKVGSAVTRPPHMVRLWFTEPLEPAFSSAEVLDHNGREIDRQGAHVNKRNPSLLVVPVPTLAPGTYTVVWNVVARDTHRTHGRFTFTVNPPP